MLNLLTTMSGRTISSEVHCESGPIILKHTILPDEIRDCMAYWIVTAPWDQHLVNRSATQRFLEVVTGQGFGQRLTGFYRATYKLCMSNDRDIVVVSTWG